MMDAPDTPDNRHFYAAGLTARALEGAIAGYLAFNPSRREGLPDLAGRVLALRLLPFGWQLWLCPTPTTVQVLTEFSGTPDATLSGDISALIRLSLGGVARDSLLPGEIGVDGADWVIAGFRELFAGLDRGPTVGSQTMGGGGLATAAMGLLQAGLDWGRDTATALETDLAEFWQEETRMLPSRPEADAFARDVRLLRADCDTLEARVRELEDQISPQP